MLRHCPITRFSSSGARRKMPTAVCGKETSRVPPENPPLDPADARDGAKEPLPPQKVLKIFSINIITQGLPFCRRRVSSAPCRTATRFPPAFRRTSGKMPKVTPQTWVDLSPSHDEDTSVGTHSYFLYLHPTHPGGAAGDATLHCFHLKALVLLTVCLGTLLDGVFPKPHF